MATDFKTNTEHIKVKGEDGRMIMLCEICEAEYKLPREYTGMDHFMRLINGFKNEHKKCTK